jgi:hypothetical protein
MGKQPPSTGLSDVGTIARRYDDLAVASLVATLNDPKSGAVARTTAARTILELGHGRTPQQKPITSSDLAQLTAEERDELQLGLLKLYDKGLPPVLEQLFTEMLRLATGQPEPPLPLWIPHWGDERDEQPGGVLYKRRLRRERLAAMLRPRYTPEPRPRFHRGPSAGVVDGAAATIAATPAAEAAECREASEVITRN